MTSRKQKIAAWLACLAMLLAAFAPAVSQTLSKGKSTDPYSVNFVDLAELAEICGHGGARVDPAHFRSDQPHAPADHAAANGHCPFCQHQPLVLLLPPALPTFSLFLPERFFSAHYRTCDRPLLFWTAGQPRAPPVFF